jgi:hypothetical protein
VGDFQPRLLALDAGREVRARLEADAPMDLEAYYYFIRGSAYFYSSEPTERELAEAHFDRAAKLDSTLAVALVGLGAIRGRYEQALLLMDRARELSRDAPARSCANSIAILFNDLGHVETAREVHRRSLSELEVSAAAAPDNGRLLGLLAEAYAMLGDRARYRAVITAARRALGQPRLDVGWSRLARAGLEDEALAVVAARDSMDWYNVVDSVGVPPKPLPAAVARVMASPEFLRTQAAIDACQLRVFEYYRARVASAFPGDPDVPPARTQWPPRPPYE